MNKQTTIKKEVKQSDAEICDYIVTVCPYCEEIIEEYWGRVNDLTITDPEDGMGIDCPRCQKQFIVNFV